MPSFVWMNWQKGDRVMGSITISPIGRHHWYEWIDRKETRSWEVLRSVQLDAIIGMNELTERRQGHGKYYDQSSWTPPLVRMNWQKGDKVMGSITISPVGCHHLYEWIDRKETGSWEVLWSVQLDGIICMNELTERRQGHGKYYDQSFECESFVCESSWPLCRKDGSRPVCVCVCVCVHGCKPLVFPSTMHATLFYHCDNFQPQRPTSPAVDSNTDFFVLISHFALEWNDENLDGHH